MAKREISCRAPGNYDVDVVSASTALRCEDESLAVQSEKDEADINRIVERFGLTGELPVTRRVPFPTGVDFDSELDFRQANDLLIAARESFMSLPARVRSQFENDPMEFADFAAAPENLPQLREWGLAPAEAPEPVAAPEPSPAA